MNVGQLKEKLENLPDDMEIFMSKDAEGNDFKYIRELEVEFTRLWVDYELEVLHPEDYEELDEEDKAEVEKRIVLWP